MKINQKNVEFFPQSLQGAKYAIARLKSSSEAESYELMDAWSVPASYDEQSLLHTLCQKCSMDMGDVKVQFDESMMFNGETPSVVVLYCGEGDFNKFVRMLTPYLSSTELGIRTLSYSITNGAFRSKQKSSRPKRGICW